MTQVIHFQEDDDLAVLRAHLRRVRNGRVVLVLPWDARFLSRPLDGDLVRREAEKAGVDLAIVSRDPERRSLIRGTGLPVFSSVAGAEEAADWRRKKVSLAEPPPQAWWEEEVPAWPPPRHTRPTWLRHVGLGVRILIFIATLLLLVGAAYVIIPSAYVTLVPAGQTVDVIVPISVSQETETVDPALGLIPGRPVGDYFEGSIQVETTGTASSQSGRATGTVLFTNLLGQDVVVPSGTMVRTSAGGFPVRFATTQQAVVPPLGQVLAPIQAMEEGPVGNVGANQINQVEGFLAFSVRVTNPDPTYGGAIQEVRAVSQADRERAQALLTEQLLDEAYEGLQVYLEPTEFLPRQSLVVMGSELSYDRFLNEPAETLSLHMRLLVRGVAVDRDNAEAVAYAALADRVPDGYSLIDTRFTVGEVAEETVGVGEMAFFATATGYAAADIDIEAVKQSIRGIPVGQTVDRLMAEFPLAEPPRLQVWPEWFDRMPTLPLRIAVEVIPRRMEE